MLSGQNVRTAFWPSRITAVISGWWVDDKERQPLRQCAMELRLRSRRFHLEGGSNWDHKIIRLALKPLSYPGSKRREKVKKEAFCIRITYVLPLLKEFDKNSWLENFTCPPQGSKLTVANLSPENPFCYMFKLLVSKSWYLGILLWK